MPLAPPQELVKGKRCQQENEQVSDLCKRIYWAQEATSCWQIRECLISGTKLMKERKGNGEASKGFFGVRR